MKTMRRPYDNKLKKETEQTTLTFSSPNQLKELINKLKGSRTTTDFVVEAIKEMLNKLKIIELIKDTKTKHISISRPDKETELDMYKYIKEKKVFVSRGSLIRFSILFKVLTDIELEEEPKPLTVEEYLQKNNLRIIGKA